MLSTANFELNEASGVPAVLVALAGTFADIRGSAIDNAAAMASNRLEPERRVLERNSDTWWLRVLMFLRSQLHAFLSPCK